MKDFDDNINVSNLSKIAGRMISYDDNILITGGTDGKHIISDIYELDTNDNNISRVGKLNAPRNNFHYLINNGDMYVVGGTVNHYKMSSDIIENYVEKFTFNLANEIESTDVPVKKNVFSIPMNLSNDFMKEPGFSYSSSIILKQFI